MLLHRYFASHAFETLKEAKLKTSRITSFNDPFEFLFVTKGKLTPAHVRKYIEYRRYDSDFLGLVAGTYPQLRTAKNPQKFIDKILPAIVAGFVRDSDRIVNMPFEQREQMADITTRIICFSNSTINVLDEILLWSHYAKMHEGVRIGFEIAPDDSRFKVFKVKYSEKRLQIDVSAALADLSLGASVVESAKMKSLAWEYEDEYRLMTHPQICERKMVNSKVECFLSFDRKWIKTIDFGVRCPQSEISRILDVVKTDYANQIKCRKAVFHKVEYALEYEAIKLVA